MGGRILAYLRRKLRYINDKTSDRVSENTTKTKKLVRRLIQDNHRVDKRVRHIGIEENC